MDFLEKDLEQIIWESSDEKLEERGLYLSGKRFRQLRIGNYGVADLVTLETQNGYSIGDGMYSTKHKYITITVYELKKDKIGISAFLQAVSYIKGIKSYIEKRKLFQNFNIEYRITLIGRTMDLSGSFAYLPELLKNEFEQFTDNYNTERPIDLSYYTYDYEIDGLTFENRYGFCLTDEGF